MNQLVDAEAKVLKLINLLKSSGGLRIEAEFLDTSLDNGSPRPGLSIELSGSDMPALLHNNAELLRAIQHVAAGILRRESPDADRIRSDAGNAETDKNSEPERLARAGIHLVRTSSSPGKSAAMMACERQLPHLALVSFGLNPASTLGPARNVVSCPEAVDSVDHSRPIDRSPLFKSHTKSA